MECGEGGVGGYSPVSEYCMTQLLLQLRVQKPLSLTVTEPAPVQNSTAIVC